MSQLAMSLLLILSCTMEERLKSKALLQLENMGFFFTHPYTQQTLLNNFPVPDTVVGAEHAEMNTTLALFSRCFSARGQRTKYPDVQGTFCHAEVGTVAQEEWTRRVGAHTRASPLAATEGWNWRQLGITHQGHPVQLCRSSTAQHAGRPIVV